MDIQLERAWPTTPGGSSESSLPEQRRRERLAVKLPMRLKSMDLTHQEVTEIQTTVNFNRHGAYFETDRWHYRPRTRLLVTFPFCVGKPCHDYGAQVVRVQRLAGALYGVGVRFLYVERRIVVPSSSEARAVNQSRFCPRG